MDRQLEAWNDYKESCRLALEQDRYEQVEPWVWKRLVRTLREIGLTPWSGKADAA